MLSNDAAIEVGVAGTGNSAWLDVADYDSWEEFQIAATTEMGTDKWYVVQTQGLPKAYCHRNLTPRSTLFTEFGQLPEHDREVVYLYSLEAGSSTHYDNLISEAKAKSYGIWSSMACFAKHEWLNSTVLLEGVANEVVECIDWDKVAQRLQDSYVFTDCAEGYLVFSK